ncbi:MAG: ABC transporter ATP-binding protein [Candidatus Electronema sp. V4]|uniref:ABC transporter ATP-binding protein n=1 Tax=Candidatus Electronema sp. V4 TaxID=3454756 RepID=UPI0040558ECE
MSDTVIQIEGLWKEYRLGVIGYGTLTRDLQSWWAKVRGKEDPNSKIQPMLVGQEKQIEGDRFWALRDINLEVKEGEILGIIGRNGAGKSTLLKLLSRVTAPTKGQIKIKGRIASLLEVGTGFHPELTGRENIFMNGAILGMSKQEIKSKLDEIIDFSGVEKFIGTPVKRYSSGMYVRLAFAVAAHLEPEILVVDEVLAVGDSEFQKKCLGKMEEVSKTGRTVLFVSHNMTAIEALCTKGIVFNKGRQEFQGIIKESIELYLNSHTSLVNQPINKRKDRSGLGNVRIIDLYIQDVSGNKKDSFPIGASLNFIIKYLSINTIKKPHVIIGIYDPISLGMVRLDTEISGSFPTLLSQKGELSCLTAPFNLSPGRYTVNIAFFSNGEEEDYIIKAISFNIVETDYFKTGKLVDGKLSKVIFQHDWSIIA